ncbi:DUF1801 domain-containing protein [Flammeovirgaceae bacterium SG7u.111]|nr:DUF1801 domain-containing protein [Flammeovirgaceae bacterium SG7u.132]WPO33848.1 DUF1801 domain-containing protein [Flammeovirgaceae bacterium SG7u.111]
MLSNIDDYYLGQPEPMKSCLLALREIILSSNANITEAWKYSMPFFCYKGKMFCYFWKDKKTGEPYIGWVDGGLMEHSALEQGNRARMKILRINPAEDLPIELIAEVLEEALEMREGF